MKSVFNKVILAFLTFLFTVILSFIPGQARTAPPQVSSPILTAQTQFSEIQKTTSQNLRPADLVFQKEKDWKKDYESYFGGIFANKVLKADAIDSKLKQIASQTGKRPAVIYMVPTPKQLELVLVTPGADPIRKSISGASRDILILLVKQFRTEVSDTRGVDTTSYLASGQQLYQWLIAPLENNLKQQNIDTLLFCVGPGLRSLPFAALHDGQQFLIEKYSISLIPGFSLTDTRYTDIKKAPVLAMGASEFKKLNPLPAVPIELSTIVQNQGGRIFLNNRFTVDNLQVQQRQEHYQIIHLATHAEFQPGVASNSFIQFWNAALSLNQLRKLRLNEPSVNLLVLSACKTALGDKQAELGFAGLAVEAGVKTALGSLWLVSDTGTLGLMTEFYKYLRTAPTKAEALRQAQIALLKGQVQLGVRQLRRSRQWTGERTDRVNMPLSHPYYWSAFTMIGSPW